MAIQILIDEETFRRLSILASANGSQTVDEISKALKSYIDLEEQKLRIKSEGKQYLCEG